MAKDRKKREREKRHMNIPIKNCTLFSYPQTLQWELTQDQTAPPILKDPRKGDTTAFLTLLVTGKIFFSGLNSYHPHAPQFTVSDVFQKQPSQFHSLLFNPYSPLSQHYVLFPRELNKTTAPLALSWNGQRDLNFYTWQSPCLAKSPQANCFKFLEMSSI